MNSFIYKIQKISKEKLKYVFFHHNGLEKDLIQLSKGKDLKPSYEKKLSWEDEFYVKYENFESPIPEKKIKSISLKKKKKILTFTHNNSSVLNEIFIKLRSKTCLKNFQAHYKYLKLLGNGTFGIVCLYQSLLDTKRYASKSIKIGRSQVAVKNEIKILRKINHPNIIKLHSVYKDGEDFQLVFDFIEGSNLKELILQNGPLSMHESFILLETLINISKYLKEKKIIHRDIKPENIMIKDSKILKENIILIDFGLSEFVSNSYDNFRCGTPGFIAPEILRFQMILDSRPYDEKSDIFGIGITWYFSIFRKIPYKSQNQNNILEDNKACKFKFEKDPKYEEIKDLLASFLEADPDQRFDPSKIQPYFFFDLFSKHDNLDFEEKDINRVKKNMRLFNMNQIHYKNVFILSSNNSCDDDTNDSLLKLS